MGRLGGLLQRGRERPVHRAARDPGGDDGIRRQRKLRERPPLRQLVHDPKPRPHRGHVLQVLPPGHRGVRRAAGSAHAESDHPGELHRDGHRQPSAVQPLGHGELDGGNPPTDGIRSLSRSTLGGPLEEVTNSPTNYAGATGTIDASGGPALPGVPGLLVGKITPDGGSLSVSWDVAACTGEADHQILYGQKSGFPAIAGGTYTLAGGQCSIGTTSPFAWSPAPSASDGSGLLWFLVVAENNAGTEGPWGKDKAGAERNGSGPGGSSAVCAITGKNLANACGQ